MKSERIPAIISYLTFIGFVVALVLNNKTQGTTRRLNAFHLRQSLGVLIVQVVLSTIFGSINLYSVAGFFNVLILIVIVFQLVAAASGEKKEIPYIGKYFSKIFANAFE